MPRIKLSDYYSTKQLNLIKRWNVSITAIKSLAEVAQNQSGISDTYVAVVDIEGDPDSRNWEIIGWHNSTYTLTNGTEVTVRGLDLKASDGSSGYLHIDGTKTESYTDQYGNSVIVKGTTENDPVTYIDRRDYTNRLQRVETLNSDLQSEVDPFVNGTWTAFQDGQINASDVISRNNLMFRYGTDALNNSNQSLYDSTAALASMGLDTPNINNTGSMTVVYEGVTYEGMVLAREAPNGTWETNTTYNTAEIGGTVLLATTDGQRIDMEGEFTLQEMKNQDGDQIEETQATKVVYKTSNTSEILDKMNRILELRAQVEATKPKAGGGGTSTDDDGNGFLEALASFLGISAGAAAVVLLGAGVVVYKVYTP